MGLQKRIYMGMTSPTIIPGTRYGYLVLTGVYIPGYRDGKKQIYAKTECICDCGNISLKQLSQVKRGYIKCCSHKCPYYVGITHGLSMDENSKLSKEYQAWYNMIRRCDNLEDHSYPSVGGRGISYHESLSTIEGFWNIMGEAPSKYHKFMRIDKDGDYEPGNVHWYLASGRKK